MNRDEAEHLIRRMKRQWPEPHWPEQEEIAWLNLFTDFRNFNYAETVSQLTAWTRVNVERPHMADIARAVLRDRNDDDRLPLSDPRAWAAFVKGSHDEADRLGRPRVAWPTDPPRSMSDVLRGRLEALADKHELAFVPDEERTTRTYCAVCGRPFLPGSTLIVCGDCDTADEEPDW